MVSNQQKKITNAERLRIEREVQNSVMLTEALREILKSVPDLSHYALIEAHLVKVNGQTKIANAMVIFVGRDEREYSIPFKGCVPDIVSRSSIQDYIDRLTDYTKQSA